MSMNIILFANNILESNTVTDKQNSSWPSFIEAMGQLFSLILILAIVIFIIYFFAKSLTKLRVGMGGENIKIIEYKNLGVQNNLVLVQVSNRFFLVASTKEKISLIAELNEEDINTNMEEKKSLDFKEILSSYTRKNKNEVE